MIRDEYEHKMKCSIALSESMLIAISYISSLEKHIAELEAENIRISMHLDREREDTIHYCKVIAELEISYTDLEYNSACILEYATGGRASKPHINYEIAHRLIDDNIEYWIKEHITELSTPKSCDGCIHQPLQGENYYEPCGACKHFYVDYYEPKDLV